MKFSSYGVYWDTNFKDRPNNNNKILISKIYITKQDIRIHIYVAYSRPNGWIDWAGMFWGHSWIARECLRLKKSNFFSSNKKKIIIYFLFLFFLRATPGIPANTLYYFYLFTYLDKFSFLSFYLLYSF